MDYNSTNLYPLGVPFVYSITGSGKINLPPDEFAIKYIKKRYKSTQGSHHFKWFAISEPNRDTFNQDKMILNFYKLFDS